jgi:hypothetical protein
VCGVTSLSKSILEKKRRDMGYEKKEKNHAQSMSEKSLRREKREG